MTFLILLVRYDINQSTNQTNKRLFQLKNKGEVKMSLSEQFGCWIKEIQYEQMQEVIANQVKRAIVDTVAVIVAGAEEDVAHKIIGYIKRDRARGPVKIISQRCRFSPTTAALVNGTMAHALDFDDVNPFTKCHASAVLVPTILAVGEDAGSSGKELITAYVVGLEIMSKLCQLLSPLHYQLGWHTTVTLGAFGATAAAARLYGLSVPQIENALGIVASRIGGLRKNFGTMTKPLHSGFAAESGVMSALLARSGVTAGREVFEGEIGFLHAYGERSKPVEEQVDFREPWEICSSGLQIKRYPSCLGTHRAADAVLDHFNRERAFTSADIEELQEITCTGPKGVFMAVIHDRPTTGLEGKFSVQYVVAAALLDKKINMDSFTDEMVLRPPIQRLISKIRKVELPLASGDSYLSEGQKYITVSLHFKNGDIWEKKINTPKGSPRDPLSDQQLNEKFTDCTKIKYSPDKSRRLLNLINSLDKLDNIFPITALL
jgi:2-methylcitrate dehydratase PrpD